MTILAVSDLHCPFVSPRALPFLAGLKRQYKPDAVVFIGDEIDAHALSRYPKDPDGFGAGHELAAARRQLEPLFRLFPVAKICESNHTSRIYKKAFEAGLPACALKPMSEILGAPKGWQWADKWEVDGIQFVHGDGYTSRNWSTAPQNTLRRTVMGHTHAQAGVVWGNAGLWAMNVGCLVDHTAYVFNYARQARNQPTLGCGLIEKGVPRFIPLSPG